MTHRFTQTNRQANTQIKRSKELQDNRK